MEFHHLAISVRDLERSIKFYQEIFGFEEVTRFTKEGWRGEAVVLNLKETHLELFCFEDAVENKDDLSNFKVLGYKHMAFKVDNIDDKYQELKAKNIEISKPEIGKTCKFCFLKDPDGFPIELYE